MTWTTVASKRADDPQNMGIFELETLSSGWLYLTAKAPTAT